MMLHHVYSVTPLRTSAVQDCQNGSSMAYVSCTKASRDASLDVEETLMKGVPRSPAREQGDHRPGRESARKRASAWGTTRRGCAEESASTSTSVKDGRKSESVEVNPKREPRKLVSFRELSISNKRKRRVWVKCVPETISEEGSNYICSE